MVFIVFNTPERKAEKEAKLAKKKQQNSPIVDSTTEAATAVAVVPPPVPSDAISRLKSVDDDEKDEPIGNTPGESLTDAIVKGLQATTSSAEFSAIHCIISLNAKKK